MTTTKIDWFWLTQLPSLNKRIGLGFMGNENLLS